MVVHFTVQIVYECVQIHVQVKNLKSITYRIHYLISVCLSLTFTKNLFRVKLNGIVKLSI